MDPSKVTQNTTSSLQQSIYTSMSNIGSSRTPLGISLGASWGAVTPLKRPGFDWGHRAETDPNNSMEIQDKRRQLLDEGRTGLDVSVGRRSFLCRLFPFSPLANRVTPYSPAP
jgi:hypothetical protein